MDNSKILRDVEGGWRAAKKIGAFPSAAQMLRDRGISPDLVTLRGQARGVGAEAQLILREHMPSAEIGDIIAPVWGADGRIKALRLWCMADGLRKAMMGEWAQTGLGGVVAANPLGVQLLKGKVADGFTTLIIVEGEPDAMVCDQAWPSCAVWGVYAGGWTPELGERASEGAWRVVIRTDDDAAGERYAVEIARSLREGCEVWRYRAPNPGQDQNDLWREGRIGDGETEADPLVFCEVFEMPPVVEVTPTPKPALTQEAASEGGDDDRGWAVARSALWWLPKWEDAVRGASAGGGTNAGKGGRGWTGQALICMRAAEGLRQWSLTAEQEELGKEGLSRLQLEDMKKELTDAATATGDKKTKADRRLQIKKIAEKAAKNPLDFEGLTRKVDAGGSKKKATKTKAKAATRAQDAATQAEAETQPQARVILPAYEDQPAVEAQSETAAANDEVEDEGAEAFAFTLGSVDPRNIKARFGEAAPVSEDARLPHSYRFDGDGSIWREVDEEERQPRDPVCTAPLFITGISRDQFGQHWREVSWLQLDGSWGGAVIPRSAVADRAGLVRALAPEGAPVNSTYAASIAAYLDQYERANAHCIPSTRVQTRMGWTDGGGFLLGSRCYIGPDGSEAAMKEGELPAPGCVSFHATEGGERQEGRAFCREPRGTMAGWIEAASEAKGFPAVMYGLWASLAAPLVSALGLPTPIIDWSAPDGTGKTTVLMLAASVWGHPDESGGGEDGQVIQGWDQTQVALERMCATRAHLPIILNDTKKRNSRLDMGQVLFMLHEGQGRGRGTIGGTAAVAGWRSIVLSTGEAKITDYASASDGGIHGRVICVTDLPWGSAHEGDRVRRFQFRIGEHWGHAGRQWVAWLAARRATEIERWRSLHSEASERYLQAAGDHPRAQRLAKMGAVVRLAATLATEALGLGVLEGEACCDEMFRRVASTTPSQKPHEEALRRLWSWTVANQSRFYNTTRKSQVEPHGGWVGRWDAHSEVGKEDLWREVAYGQVALESVLRQLGYDAPASIRSMWAQQNLTEWTTAKRGDKIERRKDRRVRIDGQLEECAIVPRRALEQVGALEPLTDKEQASQVEAEACPF